MFSSKSDNYETPNKFFNKLDEEFNFNIDVCATKENTKCSMFFESGKVDALKEDWHKWGTCWMNPPYSQVADWIKKAYEESLKGATVVCLIPSRTDTRYWHNYCMKASEIRFIKGRLKFGQSKNSAPFPSAIIIFKPDNSELKVVPYII